MYNASIMLEFLELYYNSQEKLNIYPYVNGITHTNGAQLINVHERIAIVT